MISQFNVGCVERTLDDGSIITWSVSGYDVKPNPDGSYSLDNPDTVTVADTHSPKETLVLMKRVIL